MTKQPWHERLRDHWHVVAYTVLLWLTIAVYVLHFLSPELGESLEPFLSPKNLLMIILMFVALNAALNKRDSARVSDQLVAINDAFPTCAEFEEMLDTKIATLANVRYFATKDETFKRLTGMTIRAQQVLMATRFSSGDITLDEEYWAAAAQRALDPSILSIRIHSLAHHTSRPVDVLSKIIEQFKGAQQFTLGVAFFNNEFEMIISDDEEAIFCFHDFEMTIRNGLYIDSSWPSGEAIVRNFGDTFRRMLGRCHLVIEFDRFVRNDQDVKRLQSFLRSVHEEYSQGDLFGRPRDMDDFLQGRVFSDAAS